MGIKTLIKIAKMTCKNCSTNKYEDCLKCEFYRLINKMVK